MTENEILSIAEEIANGKKPSLPERCINQPGNRCLHEELGINHPTQIGATMYLRRKFGFPSLKDFIAAYFASGLEFEQMKVAQAEEYGRSPGHLLSLCNQLFLHATANPISNANYTFHLVAEWFLFLIFVRTTLGSRAERLVWNTIGTLGQNWRFSSYKEDIIGIDFINASTNHIIQVKKDGWHLKQYLLNKWLRDTQDWKNRRWLIEYIDSADNSVSISSVYSDKNGGLDKCNLEEIQLV